MDQVAIELLVAVYTVVSFFATAYAVFHYVAVGVSLSRMMDRMGMPNRWMPWVPFCSVYALGDLADTYNLLCESKATRYGKRSLTWFIVTVALAQPVLLVLYAMKPDAAVPTDLWLLLIGLLAAAVVYSVFYYISLYKVYRLFAGETTGLLVLSILVGISVPLILLVLSRREVRLPFEDREEDGDGEDGSADGDAVGEYSAF